MKVNELWLREWVDTDLDIQTIGDRLTMAGLELDGLESASGEFDKVIVGEITSMAKHPDADKLNVCQVTSGEGKVSQVVCGAPNARKGLKTAFAMVGANLPEIKIKKAKLRGVESMGMLCSSRELELDDDAQGIIEFPEDAPVGQEVREYLQLDDFILDLDLTPNRADCLSVSGIARDLAAITETTFTEVEVPDVDVLTDSRIEVSVEATEDCPRYTARIIEGINPVSVTPLWMKEKLRRCGIRAISPVVDITNFVLLELGQPMHAFDRDLLTGGIVVRHAVEKESLILLDDKKIGLKQGSLVIADHNRVLALAGIMGGLESAVTDITENILLESACFSAEKIAGRARSYGLHTESSHRFERGVDPDLQVRALERASQLVIDICGGRAGPVINIDNTLEYKNSVNIQLSTEDISSRLGIDVLPETIEGMLSRLGCDITTKTDQFTVLPPAWRYDLRIPEDLIEEVARLYGYDNIPMVTSSFQRPITPVPETTNTVSILQQRMLSLGYQEAITYSFIDSKIETLMHTGFQPVALQNPISAELAVMRTTLLGGLIQTTVSNQRRQQNDARLFETGLVFQKSSDDLKQIRKIAGVISGVLGRDIWNLDESPLDFYDLKGDVEALVSLSGDEIKWTAGATQLFHPGQSATLTCENEIIGYLGAIHPELKMQLGSKQELFAFEININSLENGVLPEFKPLSKYQSVRRDLSILVSCDIDYEEIKSCVNEMHEGLITNFHVFDQYSGEGVKKGLKSIAFSLILQEFSRTLEEKEIDELVSRVADQLHQKFGATLRE